METVIHLQQIANTDDIKEKNEIFVETLVSTTMGAVLGSVVGLFLISSPVGWGTAIVLATGTTVASYLSGKAARLAYTTSGHRVDFVTGTGTDRLCKK